ncbi:MAG: PAS domain S-box protein [Syntrophorhabdaceae bacterium]|nr:PAS domain S-box protein [Syntrophorhabdaceae bacterium]
MIIHSYHHDFEWTDGVQSGIRDTLKSEKGIELYTEYMDLIRHPSTDEYLNALEKLYQVRYVTKDNKPDVIVVVDDNAFEFVLKRRERLFDGIPLVFCGVNDFDLKSIKGIKKITGVNEKKSIRETIELAMNLSKNPKNLAVIAGERRSERINLEQFKKEIKSIKHNLNIVYLNGLELDEIRRKIGELSEEDIVIFLSYLRTAKGNVFSLDEALRALTNSTKAKIYGTNDVQIKYGVIGGKVVYAHTQGEEAAKMVKKILSGVDADNIPILMDSPNRYLFDGVALKKHGISLTQLPKGSIIINKAPEQLVGEWKGIIESSRLFSYEFFRNHGTVMLIIDPTTGTILDANETARLFYGYQELVGKKIQEINTLTEEEVKQEMQKAKATKKNFFNFRHRLSNGDIRDVEVYSYPVRIKDKTLLFSIIFDVTEKLRALRLREEKDRMFMYFMIILTLLLVSFSSLLIFYLFKRRAYERDLLEKNKKLEEAKAEIKTLSGIIPICMHCKKIRDDKGYWNHLEKFISEHSDAMFSHSLCPDCQEKYYKDFVK